MSANDEMYGGARMYVDEVNRRLAETAGRVAAEVEKLAASSKTLSRQQAGTVALEFMDAVLDHSELNAAAQACVRAMHKVASVAPTPWRT